MITAPEKAGIRPVGARQGFWLYVGPRERADDWMVRYRNRGNQGPCAYEVVPIRTCQVCGEDARIWIDDQSRCRKHQDRNPCCIEGCKRTRAAKRWLTTDTFMCSEHYRAFVPPGSPERRILNRFFRRAKKLGWDDEGEVKSNRPVSGAAYWRVWNRIVSRARARVRGEVDEREINRIMGW